MPIFDCALARLQVGPSSFRIEDGKQTVGEMHLDEIVRLEAYKRDQITVDLVCVDVSVRRDGQVLVWLVHEELPGFDALMERLAQLAGFDLAWREKVIQPPFADNRTVIFERGAS